MMEPTAFDEENCVLTNESDLPLSALYMEDGENRLFLTCWKPTMEELVEINRTGRIWVLMKHAQLPICLTGHKHEVL